MRLPIFLLLAALLPSLSPAAAATTVAGDSKSIRRAAEQFLEGWTADLLTRMGPDARISTTVAVLDPRLAMPACGEALRVEAREQLQLSARINLQVSCGSGNTWSLFVPVELALYRPVVTTARPLGHGDTLAAADLQLVEHNVTRLSGQYLLAIEEAAGMAVRRPIAQGVPVITEHLQPPLLIRRGDTVLITAAGSAVAVKMSGTAMTDGRRGEQIRIRNSASGRVVSGRVTSPGVVEVRL